MNLANGSCPSTLSQEEKIIDINQSLNRFIGSVIRFFMNQFICLVYILFLFAGVVCGVISALIEYEEMIENRIEEFTQAVNILMARFSDIIKEGV